MAEIYRYGAELLDADFAQFAKEEAVALCVALDGTTMRFFLRRKV